MFLRVFIAIVFSISLFTLSAPALNAEESAGSVRGRILYESGAPASGLAVSAAPGGEAGSSSFTAEDGTYALKAVIGRKSVKFKVGLNLFGLTTKTQHKEDIRVREIELTIGEGKGAKKISAPVFYADLPGYSVYLHDIVLPEGGGSPRYNDAGYFSVEPIRLSSRIVKDREELKIEVPVNVPPFPELAADMRVVVRGALFGDKGIKAFDNGKDSDAVRGDGIYTASTIVSSAGPFGFFLVSADVLLPELAAVYKPGEAWPVMFTSINTSEAGGRVERVTEIYSLGGIETGLSAEWYYYCGSRNRDGWAVSAYLETERQLAKSRWYSSFARSRIGEATAPLFVCRGMLEYRAARALARAMEAFDSGDYETALIRLEDARVTAPDYESIPLWEALIKYRLGDLQGAIDAITSASSKSKDSRLKVVFAELCREAGDSKNAVEAYLEAFRDVKDPQILRTAAHYMYELGDYRSAQKAFDALKSIMNESAYGYGFLMFGQWDFPVRFGSTAMRAEQYLFRDFAAPQTAWQRAMFEEAYVLGSLSGWQASRRAPSSGENARKYSTMLRLAGMFDESIAAASNIGGAAQEFEIGLAYMEIAGANLQDGNERDAALIGGALASAIEKFVSIYEDNAENAVLNYNVALAHYLAGDAQSARPYCEIAVEKAPRMNSAHFLLANVCEDLGDLENAIKHWQWFADDAPEGAVKILASEHLESLKSAAGRK